MALPKLIPLEVLFGNPARSSPAISPNGTRLAWNEPIDGVMNVWVGNLDGSAGQPVTHDTGRGIRSFQWAPDSRHLLYTADKDGDEHSHVHLLDLDTGSTKDVTPIEGVQAQIVATSKNRPTEILVGMNQRDLRRHDLFRLNLDTGELEEVARNEGYQKWLIDHDLQVRGAVQSHPDGSVDWLIDDGSGPWSSVRTIEPEDSLVILGGVTRFTADGDAIHSVDSVGGDTARLIRFHIESGKTEVISEHSTADIDIALFAQDTHEPLLVSAAPAKREWVVLDESVRADVEALEAASGGQFGIASRDDADRKWIVSFSGDTQAPEYHLFDRDSKKITLLFKTQPEFDQYELARMEHFSFQASDGLTINAYATFPPGVDPKNLPTVLSVHGGPWGARHFWGWNVSAQWLANRGYLCIEVNYRGSGGYGKSFVNASAQEWAGKMHTDLLEALDEAASRGWVDRDRMAIMGGSYGGYATLVGVTFTPDVFKCGIDSVGPSNLITLLNTFPPYWETGVRHVFDRLLATRDQEEYLWSKSPLSKVDQIKVPLLVAQGANDPRVKQDEAEQIVAAMKERGIEHEYLLFPDEGHGFVKPENSMKFRRAAERFLAKHLGGRYEE